MSMVMTLRRATDEQVADLLAEPERIRELTESDMGEEVMRRLRAKRPGCLGRLLGIQPALSVADVEDLLPETELSKGENLGELELDKAWHGLHYLLTGTAWEGEWPLNFIVRGGEEVGDIDVGYGPARVLRGEQVRELAAALEALSEEDVRGRFDVAAMSAEDVYPPVWEENPEWEVEWLMGAFGELKGFIAETAERGLGLVMLLW